MAMPHGGPIEFAPHYAPDKPRHLSLLPQIVESPEYTNSIEEDILAGIVPLSMRDQFKSVDEIAFGTPHDSAEEPQQYAHPYSDKHSVQWNIPSNSAHIHHID
jgi:hypothetical protein